MTEFGLDDAMRQLLLDLRGQRIDSVYANSSQVLLVLPTSMFDMQPSCRRLREGSFDEACFAGAQFSRGHHQEAPRDEPSARGVVLAGVKLVSTTLCLETVSRPLSRRLLNGSGGTHGSEETREWLADPEGEEARNMDPSQAFLVEAGFVLEFDDGSAVAAFCPNNVYRFAIDDETPLRTSDAIERDYADRYRFRAL